MGIIHSPKSASELQFILLQCFGALIKRFKYHRMNNPVKEGIAYLTSCLLLYGARCYSEAYALLGERLHHGYTYGYTFFMHQLANLWTELTALSVEF